MSSRTWFIKKQMVYYIEMYLFKTLCHTRELNQNTSREKNSTTKDLLWDFVSNSWKT